MTIAEAIRASVPLGLNVDPPFFPISDALRPPSLIPPPTSVIEGEIRRNTFWLLYAMERMGGCSNGWALSLDDQDISQLLPVKGVNFEMGVSTIFSLLTVCMFVFLFLTEIRSLRGSGANGNMVWQKTSFFFTQKIKLTRSVCMSKGVYYCRGSKPITFVFARSVTWEIPHLHIFLQRRKYGERTVMNPRIDLQTHGELQVSSRSTTLR